MNEMKTVGQFCRFLFTKQHLELDFQLGEKKQTCGIPLTWFMMNQKSLGNNKKNSLKSF